MKKVYGLIAEPVVELRLELHDAQLIANFLERFGKIYPNGNPFLDEYEALQRFHSLLRALLPPSLS